jgi:heptosyltransferase-2
MLETAVRLAARVAPSAPEPPDDPRSLFVLRNNDLGDLIVVTPLFEALRRRFPEAVIAAGVGDWSRDVLRHNPHVSEVLPVNAPWFNKYAPGRSRTAYLLASPEVREIARRRFDVGIDVLGSAWGSLLLLRAKIPYRLGVRGYAGGCSAAQRTVEFDPALSVGRSALRFAELLGATDLPDSRPQLFLSQEEREAAERWWAQGEGGQRIVVGPGGGLAVKCWPPESFAELLRGLGEIPGLSLLLLGGERERELLATLAAACPATRALPEPPGLRQVFALVAAADLVVCNSSLLLHVAAAFGKRSVVLLGESFPSANLHQVQWGHPGLSLSLGKEPGLRKNLYTPREALDILQEEIAVR